jgi:protein SCO1/2
VKQFWRYHAKWWALAAVLAPLHAQSIVPWADRAESKPAAFSSIGFEQKLNAQLPLDLAFRDEQGRPVLLGEFFNRKKPVVLTLVYYECPMLCTVSLNGLLRALRTLSFTAGKEFEVVTVSINPRETPELAAAKQRAYLEKYRRDGADWHFLTGEEPAIEKLADTVGFRYKYDPASGQFAHTTGILVATPQGRVARYQFGVEYSARDLRLGIIEAAAEKIGTTVDQVLLYCFNYDAATGRYTPAIMNILRAAAAATLALLGTAVVVLGRRHRRRKVPA